MNAPALKTLLFPAILGLTLSVTGLPSLAAQNQDAPGELLLPARSTEKVELPARAVNQLARLVAVNHRALDHSRIHLDLFDGRRLVASRDRTEEHGLGGSVWVGRVEGEPLSRVSIASRNGTVAGAIDRPTSQGNELLEVHPVAPGIAVLFPVDESRLPLCAPPAAVSDPGEGAPADNSPVLEASTSPETIDLMVVYTPASATRNGGPAGMEAKILQAVADANTGYRNSEIGVHMRLVYMGLVDYTETGTMADAVARLKATGDGFMDEVHILRDQYGADLVALIDEDSDACGNALMIKPFRSDAASLAFCVVYSACLSNLTLPHELGHLQGCHHNIEDAGLNAQGLPIQGAFAYSYGWRVCNSRKSGFRTVMSYSCTFAARINYFSNPRLSYNGAPLGIPYNDDPTANYGADNARSMNETALRVAGFRAPTVPPAPEAPSGLVATPVSARQINLRWVAGAGGCAGFLAERSTDQSTWAQIADTTPATTAFADQTLVPNTLYYYRVRAYNQDAQSGVRAPSAYSNTASARTKRR